LEARKALEKKAPKSLNTLQGIISWRVKITLRGSGKAKAPDLCPDFPFLSLSPLGLGGIRVKVMSWLFLTS
jgi:hypothetical protein